MSIYHRLVLQKVVMLVIRLLSRLLFQAEPAPYEYQYSYDDAKGIKHIITAYTAGKTSTTWNTSSLSAGDYTIRVEVRDKNKKKLRQKQAQ